MFERFTDEARRVVVLGQEEARLRGQEQVGTEHMLLGLVDGDCDGAKALEMLEISPTTVREHIDGRVGRPVRNGSETHPRPLSPRAKKVLELSSREAVRLGDVGIGTEHILLAMLRDRECVAAQVLATLGADLPRTRQTVVELSTALGAKRERMRVAAPATIEPEAVDLDVRGPVTAAELLAEEEPAPLGAAATFSGDHPRASRAATARERMRSRRSVDDRAATPADASDTGSESDVVSVFEPGRSARPQLRPYVETLWQRRQFMVALAKAEIRGRHTSTLLGSIWGLIDPIFQAAIYLFLFFVIRGGQGRAVGFLPVLLAGYFLFRLTAGAINDGGRSVSRSKELMLSSNFPRAVLPLAEIYKGLLNFIPTIFVSVVVYVIFGAPLHLSLVLLPALFVVQTAMNIGIALLVATTTVFLKDADNAISYVVRILLFATPIIYPITLIPPGLRTLLSLNPLFSLFASYQIIIGGGGAPWDLIFQAIVWAVVMLVGGAWLFLRYEHAMAAEL